MKKLRTQLLSARHVWESFVCLRKASMRSKQSHIYGQNRNSVLAMRSQGSTITSTVHKHASLYHFLFLIRGILLVNDFHLNTFINIPLKCAAYFDCANHKAIESRSKGFVLKLLVTVCHQIIAIVGYMGIREKKHY